MKKICFLATGGTIASRPTKNGLAPGFTAQEMLAKLPRFRLQEYGKIDCYDIMQLDSTNLQPKDWQFIAKYIEKFYTDYDGFVITHGTDTLSWTCAALSCMLENLAKPIVIIGAQRTIEEEGTDALANLNAAFALVGKNYSGVYAVCGGQIIEGMWAKKLYSEDLRSIQSVNKREVAFFTENNITWHDYSTNKPSGEFKVHYELETKIAQVKIMPGLKSNILYNLADNGYKGIVIEAYGAGGIPSSQDDKTNIIKAIQDLTKQGIIIVCTSQCTYDGVHMNRYEVGINACKAGAIPAGKISTETATVILMTALGKKYNKEQILEIFAKY